MIESKKLSIQEIQNLQSKILKHNQQHLLVDIEDLEERQLNDYYNELMQLDFKLLDNLYQTFIVQRNAPNTLREEQISQVDEIFNIEQQTQEQMSELCQIGLEAIAKGEVAVIILAGGQGTRLGFDKPKGMFNLDIPSKNTIFSYYAEKLKSLSNYALSKFPQYKKENDPQGYQIIPIQLLLMTSTITDQETKNYFKSNNNFGISEQCIHYFVQGYLPSLDKNGKILLENKNKIFFSPNGNGGIYDALESSGLLKMLNEEKIKNIQMVTVDNILTKLADPEQLGLMIKKGYEVVSKYTKKRNAQENVGIHVLKNRKLSIMEYSDMSDEQKNKVDENGNLIYYKSHLCNFFATIDFYNRIINDQESRQELFQYHLANKQVSYYDQEMGQVIKPKEKNAYKFELFNIDSFPLAKSYCLMEVLREEQFAPIKNNVIDSSQDNPRTAVDLLSKLNQKQLINAGYKFDYEASWENIVEIDPKVSYFGENIPAPSPKKIQIKEKSFYLNQC